MDAQVTPELRTYIYKHQISLDTNNPDGARIYLSSKDQKTAPTNDEPLHLGAYGMLNLYPSFGTIDHPAKLSPTHFGFAIGKDISEPSQHFSDSTNYESDLEEVKRDAFFAGIPASSSLVKIYSGPSKSFPVYYGAYLDSMIKEGPHKMDIFYTVIGEGTTGELPEENHDIIETSKRVVFEIEEPNSEPDSNTIPKAIMQNDGIVTVKTNIKSNGTLSPQDINIKIDNKPCIDIKITNHWSEHLDKNLELTCKAAPINLAEIYKSDETDDIKSFHEMTKKRDLSLTITKYDINIVKKQEIRYLPIIEMQEFSDSPICKKINTGDEIIGKDSRDNELYLIEKLKDNKCWMKENLRFKLDKNQELNESNGTDINYEQNWTPPRSTETTLTERWDQDPDGVNTVRSYYDESKPKNGVYYTYAAATAGITATGLYVEGMQPPLHTPGPNENAKNSICPSGWKLPKAIVDPESNQNEFFELVKFYNGSAQLKDNGAYFEGSHNLLDYSPGFVFSGNRDVSPHLNMSNGFGDYWSATVKDNQSAYNLYFKNDLIRPKNSYSRNFGFPVRCLTSGKNEQEPTSPGEHQEPPSPGEHQEPTVEIPGVKYMQDMTIGSCRRLDAHKVFILTDIRDGKKYKIAKLKDHKCWMLENLRLVLDKDKMLTPDSSDISQNWVPARSTELNLEAKWYEDPEGYLTVRSYYDTNKPEYGVYYTHNAATAETANNLTNDGDTAPGSICPKGWKLPKTGTNSQSTFNDFYSITESYHGSMTWYPSLNDASLGSWSRGTHNMLDYFPGFIYAGQRSSQAFSLEDLEKNGNYWSSTVVKRNYARFLSLKKNSLDPRAMGARYLGFSIRCAIDTLQ